MYIISKTDTPGGGKKGGRLRRRGGTGKRKSSEGLNTRVATARRAAFRTSQPFSLQNDSAVTNVDKHFKLFYQLVLLRHLGLEVVNLLLLLLFNLLQVLASLGQLPPQLGSYAVFGRLQRLGVYGRPVLRQARGYFLRITVNGSPRIVNVPR